MARTAVDVRREARAAGIRDHAVLDLAAVERRRQQVWVFVGMALVLTSGAIAATALFPDLADRMLVDPKYLQLSLPGLCLAFAAYGFDKERSLRKITGVVIDEEISREQLRVQSSQLRAALDTGKQMAATLEAEQVVETLLNGALDLVGGTAGSVVLSDPNGGLEVAATRGDDHGSHLHHETVEMVALTRVPVRLDPEADDGGGRDASNALVVPLTGADAAVGVLVVAGPVDRPFTDQDLSVVSCFADFAASALASARRFEAQREDSQRLAAIESARNEFTWLSSEPD